MITVQQYAGKFVESESWTPERKANAEKLLGKVAELMELAKADGVRFPVNPKTGSIISGSGLGGFRPQDCKVGAPKSAHKQGLAVDIYDPTGKIDAWCMENIGYGQALPEVGIYLEHPCKTIGWSHWSIQAPRSGNRVFMP